MKNATRYAVKRFAACIGTLKPAASPAPSSSSSSTPTDCDVSRIHVNARWLVRMLAWVRATLDDAEDMNITEESIRDWLRELQEVADAAEDLLDEFPHEALHHGIVGDGGWTAGSITELPRERKMTSEMDRLHDQRMKYIVSRFMKIKKPKQALKLDRRKEQMHAESIYPRRMTNSVIEEPYIVGRVEELAKIKQFLLSSDAEESRRSDDMDDHISVMTIVGMGGLGKTTLAQLAYNDDQVNQHFQLKSWVCVSEDFDVIRLTKVMLQSLNVETSGLSELDPLQRKLLQRLSSKERFLLVLDDVWEAENLDIYNWNLLTAPLCNRSAHSKIIITTRCSEVSEMVATVSNYDLGFLSDEESLELFMQHAFEGRDTNLYQNRVVIGKEIARRCKGVPLAAKTLGGLMHNKDDQEWNKILKSEVWNATINQEESIIPLLRLSYLHLPAPLKRCFRYCSLFTKDYVFDRNEIICMWMAQGYIKANKRELMEDVGQRYIDTLLSRSFFQKCPSNPDGLQMHDLMHDLARSVSGDECYSMEDDKSCLIPTHVWHLSVLSTSDSRGTITSSTKDIAESKSLRSFLLLDKRTFHLISGNELQSLIFGHELLSDVYTKMEHLRVLDLGGVNDHRLPESIARLKHLRYLHISADLFKTLPESVGSMYHLQTLDLDGLPTLRRQRDRMSSGIAEFPMSSSVSHLRRIYLGNIIRLPSSMSNLVKLRHLILSSSYIIEYPEGIGKLTDLQTVPGFRVSPKHDYAKLGELKDMNNIRGEFAIKGLQNLADVNEAKKACLDKKRNISSLCLGWDYWSNSSYIDDEVLESLKPNVKLGSLQILGFKGPSYPSWLGDRSFSRLDTIKLELCKKWISLPPLGQLPSLRLLYISAATAVEYIGSEFFSGGFPQLEELTLKYLYNWKSWCGAQQGECPKLKNLYIEWCENLESLSFNNLGAVEKISICWCHKLRCRPGHSLELSHLQRANTININYIYNVWGIKAAHLSPATPTEDEPLLQLVDVGRREVEYILDMCSKNIYRLIVKRCWYLTSLPLGNQNALTDVEISDCPQLHITSVSPQLWQLPSLQRINVHRIHGAEIITVLEKSHLEFTNVDQLVASYLLKELSHMIRRLIIIRCANLTSLPWTDLTTLEYLRISECPLFQLLDAEQLPSTLQVLCIYGNPYGTEQCLRHQYFQRLKQVQQRSNKEGGECNLYLVFRNVHDASAALKFCSMDFTKIHTLVIEWDCSVNHRSNVTDAIMQEVIFNLYSLCISSKKLVIRGYTGSGYAGWYTDFSSKKLRTDFFCSRLSSISLLQCSKCDLAPLSKLPFLEELYVEGASSQESVMLDCTFPYVHMSERKWQATYTSIAFPRLQRLEFHDMPVWKEWLGTKEGDFPFLRKLILKVCPRLRALPHLPPGLKELILEGCDELQSLSSSNQSLKSLSSLWKLSVTNCPILDFTATKGLPPRLVYVSLTACPLLLAWCLCHPRMMASLSYFCVDGVQVPTEDFTSLEEDFKLKG